MDYLLDFTVHLLYRAETSEQEIKAVDIIIHEKWNPQTFENDIALVKLERPAMLNGQVKLACLPEQGKSPQPGMQTMLNSVFSKFLQKELTNTRNAFTNFHTVLTLYQYSYTKQSRTLKRTTV